VRPHYLAIWVNSDFGRGQVLRRQGGLAQQHFNVREMQRLLIALPSPAEQLEIETRLQGCGERIRAECVYLSKLRLLKLGLMHDLLTGKVRVPMREADG
jgi:type I restriction enzyme, S subunit